MSNKLWGLVYLLLHLVQEAQQRERLFDRGLNREWELTQWGRKVAHAVFQARGDSGHTSGAPKSHMKGRWGRAAPARPG